MINVIDIQIILTSNRLLQGLLDVPVQQRPPSPRLQINSPIEAPTARY